MDILRYLVVLGLLSTYVTGFNTISQPSVMKYTRTIHMSSSFDKKKLESIQNSISKYLKKDAPIEKGFCARVPIKKVHFDTIFLNIFSIDIIYTTPSEDRVIIQLNNGNKYVFYLTNQEDKVKIRKIIELVPNSITVKVITDKRVFDDSGFLYCENN